MSRTALALVCAGVLGAGCTGEIDEAITPVLPSADDIVMGNRTCAQVAERVAADFGDFELVVEPGAPGTYRLDPRNQVTLASEDGVHLDWSATTGVDAVLVRGGDATAIYAPGPELREGSGLTAPMNPKLEEPYAIASVVFCYDHELSVSTALSTVLERTHHWQITNTAVPPAITLDAGEVRDVTFHVDVARQGWTDSGWTVRGAIAITNPSPYPATIVGAEVWLGKQQAKVTCDAWLPMRLEPDVTTICRYQRVLDAPLATTVHAIVRTAGYEVGTGAGTTELDFASATVKEHDLGVEVWDQHAHYLGATWDAAASFVHRVTVGPYAACGITEYFPDTAAAIGVDTRTAVYATELLKVDVRCPK